MRSCNLTGHFSGTLLLFLACAASVPAQTRFTPLSHQGSPSWELVWNDEFDKTDADLDKGWISQNGPSGHILSSRWRENAVVTNGMLRLVNRKEKRGGQEWTSGSIWSKQAFQYGYFECRYRYGDAEGLNNSFWLMPTNKSGIKQGKFFEIDINEGHYPNEVNNNIHNHSDTVVVNGRRTHPTASKSFVFGVRPDVTIQLENPVTTTRVRLSSEHRAAVHIGEFRVYGPSSSGYPSALSPTADTDKAGLVNYARERTTRIQTSGFYAPGTDTSRNLVDGSVETRWTAQTNGTKWLELSFAEPRTIGCIQFLNGWKSKEGWKSLLEDYRVFYEKDGKWVEMAAFDVRNGQHNFAREFHVHGLEWTEDELVFYLDGKEIRREKNEFCHSPAPVWLSLAVIAWAGRVSDAIDGTAMEVDYVRVYRKKP